MLPLEQRYADRAARKEENSKLNAPDNTGNDRVGNVLAVVQDGMTAVESLSPAERDELQYRLSTGQPSEGYSSRLDGASPFAGIGVPNTTMFPGGAQSGMGSGGFDPDSLSPADAASAAAGALGASLPPPTEAASGAAQAEQDAVQQRAADAWGAANPAEADETVDADGKPLTKDALKAILDGRQVSYETDANLPALQSLVKANPAK